MNIRIIPNRRPSLASFWFGCICGLCPWLFVAGAAQANTIHLAARGDVDGAVTAVTAVIVYNPVNGNISHVTRTSYQGSLDWEIGRVDAGPPISGSINDRMIQLTMLGGLDRHPECGKIATWDLAGNLDGLDMDWTLTFPEDVPEGCMLSNHVAVGSTSGGVQRETVPEPSGLMLMGLAMVPLVRWAGSRVSARRSR